MRPWHQVVESGIRRCLAEPIRLSVRAFPRSQHQAIRYFMYGHLSDVLNDRSGGEILSISGSNYLAGLIANSDSTRVIEANYPESNMLDLAFDDNRFDYVVSDQVLEHIGGDPFKAIEETYRVLKPGGLAIHTTCLLIQIHAYPGDYWRFTPDGLELLCKGFREIIDVGGWGNRYLWALSWLGLLYSERVPEPSWHPYNKVAMFKEDSYPIVTWIVARK